MRRLMLLLVCFLAYGFVYSQTITANGPTSFCQGNNVQLTAQSAPTGATFQWQKDGVDIPGATSGNYTANSSGSYSAIVTDNGIPTTYGPITVTVNQYPSANFNFSIA